jgi:hypothetical protein
MMDDSVVDFFIKARYSKIVVIVVAVFPLKDFELADPILG